MANRGERGSTSNLLRMAAIVLAGAWLAGMAPAPASEEHKSTKGSAQTKPATHHAQTHPAQSRPAPTKPSGKASRNAAAKPLVFTDEDLKRYHDDSDTSAKRAPAPAPPAGDPLKTFKDQQEKERWRQGKIAETQQWIIDLEARTKLLEQKKLSIVNPLVGRPNTGEADKAAEQGLSGPELLARTEDEIRQVDEDLETARKDLAKYQESTPE